MDKVTAIEVARNVAQNLRPPDVSAYLDTVEIWLPLLRIEHIATLHAWEGWRNAALDTASSLAAASSAISRARQCCTSWIGWRASIVECCTGSMSRSIPKHGLGFGIAS